MQDVGGQANNFETNYVVGTEEISRLRVSLGYGFSSRRMEGIFAGAEVKAFDWLYLLGEYDTKETNVGARIVSPDLFGFPVNLQATFKSAVSRNPGTIDLALGVQLALGKDWHRRPAEIAAAPPGAGDAVPPPLPASVSDPIPPDSQPLKAGQDATGSDAVAPPPVTASVPKGTALKAPVAAGDAVAAAVSPEGVPAASPRRDDSLPLKAGAAALPAGAAVAAASRTEKLYALRDRLVADGFMHVRIGTNNADLLVVEYENGRYHQSELDGMGAVLGTVLATLDEEFATIRLVVKIQNIQMMQVTLPTTIVRSFFRSPDMNNVLADLIEVTYAVADEREVAYLQEGSFASWFRSRLVLTPWLMSFIATELGTFDYLLSLKIGYNIDLWKGALLSSTADIPLFWSENFNDGKYFAVYGYRYDPQFSSLMLSQALRPRHDLMISLSGGMIGKDVYGTLNEAYWFSPDGNHRLGFQQGFGRYTKTDFDHTLYLGSYRYRYTPLDTSLTVTGGSFWGNDTGVRFDLSRSFGDTAINIYYKICKTADDLNYQAGGFYISFPLTPRQGMKPYPVQLKGTNEWSYGIESITKSPDGHNYLDIAIGNTMPTNTPVSLVYYDRDRLTPEYVRNHLLRVRDAALRYVEPE